MAALPPAVKGPESGYGGREGSGTELEGQDFDPVEDLRVGQPAAAVLLDGEDVDPTQAQPARDGPGDVLVHVESEAQGRSARSFSARGEGPASRRACGGHVHLPETFYPVYLR